MAKSKRHIKSYDKKKTMKFNKRNVSSSTLGTGAAARAAKAAEKSNAKTKRAADKAMDAMPWNQKKSKKGSSKKK